MVSGRSHQPATESPVSVSTKPETPQPAGATPAATAEQVSPRVPRVVFNRMIPTARYPQRADRSAAGTLPTRAFRYCEPVVTASGFGYYIFPPINFSLRWDGTAVHWIYDGAPDWQRLTTAQFPHFAATFDAQAPEDIRGFSPPFIGSLQEPGQIQMWTGLIARTAPGWSLLVRSCVNLPPMPGIQIYEGIIDTDTWFGPLITNFRINRTDIPVEFRADYPMRQVQPLPREALAEAGQNNYELVPDMSGMRPEDWDDYYDTVVRPHLADKRPRGQYASAVRKRRKAEGEGGSAE